MQNIINWSANPLSSSIDSFKIYRAICGTSSGDGPFIASGKYLKLQTDSSDSPVTIKLSSNVVADIVKQINKVSGVFAKEDSSTKMTIRGTGSFLKIFPTDGSAALGLVPGDYIPRKDFSLFASAPFTPNTGSYQFIDPSGHKSDWYYVTTIAPYTATESLPGQHIQFVDNYLNVCCIEGFVVNFAGGEPIVGAQVKAKLFSASQPRSVASFSTGSDIANAFTDEFGRWRLTVPRCATIYLEIPSSNYSNVFVVPDQPAYYFSQIEADQAWRFTNDAKPVNGGDIV